MIRAFLQQIADTSTWLRAVAAAARTGPARSVRRMRHGTGADHRRDARQLPASHPWRGAGSWRGAGIRHPVPTRAADSDAHWFPALTGSSRS